MNLKNCRLLIHHHHIAYVDDDGAIWLSSVIGRWIEALADYFGEVMLLLYQSEKKIPQQDTLIVRKNVKLISLGTRRTVWKRIFKLSPIRQICADAGKEADVLLIRGITPHQFKVWRFTPVAHKSFLLVGSLGQGLKHIPNSLLDAFSLFLGYYHLNNIRRMAKKETLLLANSPTLVSEMEEMLKKKAHFVPTNSIRQSEFIPFQVRPVSTPWRLLYCGRLDHKKGLKELLHALSALNKQGHSCYLDVVGAKIDPIYSELVEIGNALSISGLINWHGFVPYGPKLFSYYQGVDVFILPSYSEGFPHAIWEAAANCCPVITTSVGGIPAFLTHEEHALLIPPKDAVAIVESVNRLLSDVALRGKIIEHAYHNAESFTVESCAKKLANVISHEW
jgi:glycosyltransferase involved in cell wall biosynthesis